MAAHTITVAAEHDGFALHHPAGTLADVGAAGDVGDGTTVGRHDTDIGIGVALVADELEGKPLAVGRPAVVKAAVGLIPGRAVGHLGHLLGLEVKHLEIDTVLDKGEFLAIGRQAGIHALNGGRGQQDFFLDEGGVGEVGVFLALNGGKDKFPVAVALGGIGQSAVVGAPRYPILGLRGIGNTLGSGVFNRGHKDLTANDKGHHLAIGRHGGIGSAAGERQVLDLVAVVVPQADVHLAGLTALAHGVEFAVLGEAQGTVIGNRQEAHGIHREVGHGLQLAGTVQRHRIDVH